MRSFGSWRVVDLHEHVHAKRLRRVGEFAQPHVVEGAPAADIVRALKEIDVGA
jgi:hypothetical protein